ncbi:hypothetical protein N7462_007266 [Penicillium macrosclerotiorum]|uniref:uncharacterized protein n=1 Tax=Penicillium macrosclerotiorum TaxID=303699 RepID=UPI002546D246|nr:uncharacterized protein N7462_007266 [Penicillium macrosclerotiorum]KAJ5679022.1 hypothetical protein N7462_007266 [Penicillium macrosclerotiorum]
MAGVATAYSTDPLPASGGVDNEKWEFSVPIGNEGTQHSSRPRNSHDSSSVRARSSRKRNSNGSRSSSVSRKVHAHEASYLTSTRGRREHSLSRHGSDLGSGRDGSAHDHSIRREPEEDQGEQETMNPQEMNSENWIHRDKLAKIESEELHQAAILFQRRMRAESKSSSGHGRSHDSQQSIANGPASAISPNVEHSEPWPELREGSRKEYNEHEAEDEERKHWDLRRPEEIAADEAAASIYSHPGLRKSSSRIPISTASPVPMASGRDSRGPRSRAATDEHDDEQAFRGRRASEPTTIDPEPTTPSPEGRPGSRGFNTTQNTPAKKTPGKPTGSSNRKTSAPPTNRKTSTARSRAVSGNTSQRPVTRSGESRPTTAVNRPEGDPPWLATMYKPDPRLPPDQQMLPTLAKKMQQEQWEKEGRTPTTYDRDFAPLAVHPDDVPPVPPKVVEQEKVEEPPKAKSPEPPRPNTSTGYSTMPKVQDTPPMGLTPNPNWNPPVVSAPEQPKKEKGCGCCIVM